VRRLASATGILKVIGVLLFLWLLSTIDRSALLINLRQTDVPVFLLSLLLLVFADFLKAARWHLLVHAAGMRSGLLHDWKVYNVGIFLGLITPGKLGEFGRAAYLRKGGIQTGTAVAVVLADRVFDVAVVALFSLVALQILFRGWWLAGGIGVGLLGLLVLGTVAWRMHRLPLKREWMSFLLTLAGRMPLLFGCLLLTCASWTVYCVWAVVLAFSIGVQAPLLSLMSAVMLTGIVAFLPVAPSGLGTRDASLAWLLAPLGIGAPLAVAFSFLMFLSIVLSSMIGAWYWLKGVKGRQENR